jgi:hypothetical protein
MPRADPEPVSTQHTPEFLIAPGESSGNRGCHVQVSFVPIR